MMYPDIPSGAELSVMATTTDSPTLTAAPRAEITAGVAAPGKGEDGSSAWHVEGGVGVAGSTTGDGRRVGVLIGPVGSAGVSIGVGVADSGVDLASIGVGVIDSGVCDASGGACVGGVGLSTGTTAF